MKDILIDIYNSYHNLEKNIDFDLNRDYMDLVFRLKRHTRKSKKRIYKRINRITKSTLKHSPISNEKKDRFAIQKRLLHFHYPIFDSLVKLELLNDCLSPDEFIKIFKISYDELVEISKIIFIRNHIYNNYIYDNRKNYKDIFELFGNDINCFFDVNDLIRLDPKLKPESIGNYLKLFSIDLKRISKFNDVHKIINFDNKYLLLFDTDFYYNLFEWMEIIILDSKVIGCDEYYKKRGKAFEKLVFNVLNCIFADKNLYKNLFYKFQGNRYEIDNLYCNKNDIIMFECKSSQFNIYSINSDDLVAEEIKKAFGRAYLSINKFKDFCKQLGMKKFYNGKESMLDIVTSDKRVAAINVTLYGMKFIGPNLHFFDHKSVIPVDYYPINLDFVDLLSMINSSLREPDKFIRYVYDRSEIINEYKNVVYDEDEFDMFGAANNKEILEIRKIWKDLSKERKDIKMNVISSEGEYRQEYLSLNLAAGIKCIIESLPAKNKKIIKKVVNYY